MPLRASLVSGERFLLEHRQWLQRQLARLEGDHLAPSLALREPGLLPLRGELLPLRWQEGRFARVEAGADGIVVQLPARAGEAAFRRALREFLEARMRADVGRWLPGYLPGLPRAPARLRLKVMSSQWGSLAPDGSVALDLSLVLARPSAFEYVLVHELCHLVRPDHSRAFWHEVEARFPAWRDERDWFHDHGRRTKAALRALMR